MLQRLSIRGKILAVVAVPILVLLLAVGVVTLNATQTLNTTRNVEQLLDVLSASRDYESNLQTERFLSVSYVDSYADGKRKREDAQEATDDAVAVLQEVVAEDPTPEREKALSDVGDVIGGTSPGAYLVDLRALEITSNGVGEWPTFPTAEEAQAASDSYTDIAADVDAIRVATQVAAVNESASADAGLTRALSSLSIAIEYEGVTAQNYLADPAVIQEDLIAALPKTDTSASAYDSAVEDVQQRGENDAMLLTVADAGEQLAQLPNVRTQVVNRSISVTVLNNFYSDTIEPLIRLSSDVSSVTSDRELAGQLRAYNAMDVLVESVRSEEVYTDHLLRAGVFLPGDSTFQRSLVTLSDIALNNAQEAVAPISGPNAVPDFGASVAAELGGTASFESVRSNISSGLDAALVTERGSDWTGQVAAELDAQLPIRDGLWSDAQATSSDAVQATVLQTILTVVGAVLVVGITILIALLIARRIIGPLRRLTTTATAVRQELPRMVERVAVPGETVDVSEVQIPVESTDEIGRLAEAFNGVNAATLAIAGEQAALRGSISEMFVNVARRDQVLLNRQLSSIDDMERTEEDPNTLTRLFALDHLATRMRRNSESLLVLAGIDTGRRLRRPMPLADVVRTASSEIELYERVQLELDADPAMVGHSALTAAHLFAELLENATVFSDPGSPVVVRTFERDGDVVVEVIDTGIGMTSDELREANNRVASTAASEILGAQRLGLFVVGRIARRVGARVAIESQEGAGTTATVTMPPSLFDNREAEPAGHVSGNASDADLNAPAALVGHSVADEVIDASVEPDATKRPGAPAYQPAAVESGASLTGRAADAPAASAPAEPASSSQPTEPPSEPSMDDLIAADAADAPAATTVDAAELAGGMTASGLPARRRRTSADASSASDEERAKIIGLPARATADQLSALDAEAPGGFKPSVSAEEIAPQTAEERASMFRGFRSRKDSEQDAPAETDSAVESMGQAARRGAFAAPDEAAQSDAVADAPEAPPAIPAFEGEDTPEPVAPSFAMPKFDTSDDAAGDDTPDAPPAWSIPQFEEDEPEQAAPAPATAPADEPVVVPALEDLEPPVPPNRWGTAPTIPEPSPATSESDSTPEPSAASQYDAAPQGDAVGYDAQPDFSAQPEYDAAPASSATPELEATPPYEPTPQAESEVQGVEQVSLETGPTFAAPASAPPAQTPVTPVPADSAPAEPAPQHDQAPARNMDPAELAALTATPSMDELMSHGEDEKPGFFSRLFGRGKKTDDAPAPAAPPVSPATPSPFAPTTAPAGQVAPEAAPAENRGFAPAPDETAAQNAPAAPPVSEPVASSPAQFTPMAPDQPATPTADPTPPAPAAPAAPQSFAPSGEPSTDSAEPTSWRTPRPPAMPTPEVPAPNASAPVTPPPAPTAPVATGFFKPRGDSEPQQPGFSPEELASPMGWEAAGASALQAAEPDVRTSYSPKVDLDSDHDDGADLSSAFSEFSSLSSERPKVEKTRAGLQKRRAADAPAVEVTPIEEEVVVAPRERNADDVRSRFSSFYSGTARARSDAAEFERSQATSETKE